MNPTHSGSEGATVVITHRVREGRQAEYDRWLEEIGPACRAAEGLLDWQIVRPVPGLTVSYTVIIRFGTAAQLRRWMESSERGRLIEQVQPHLAAEDDFSIHDGLDFLFVPVGARPKAPPRWKQFLVTWSAIYPLALAVPLLVLPVLQRCGVPENRFVSTLCVTAVVVSLMVFVVMPRYTRLIRRWFFR